MSYPIHYDEAKFLNGCVDLESTQKALRKILKQIISPTLIKINHNKETDTGYIYKLNKDQYTRAITLIISNLIIHPNFDVIYNVHELEVPANPIYEIKDPFIDATVLYYKDRAFLKSILKQQSEKKTVPGTEIIRRSIDGLECAGYIKNNIGKRKKASAIYPTIKLITLLQTEFPHSSDLPVIKLRKDRNYIEAMMYKPSKSNKNKKTKSHRVLPEIISQRTQQVYRDIRKYQIFIEKQPIEFTLKTKSGEMKHLLNSRPFTIQRIFAVDNKQDTQTLDMGGRFYSAPWQGYSKEERRTATLITPTGPEKLIELDFPSHHPRLLYILADMAEYQSTIKDLYEVYDSQGNKYERKILKKALLMVIYSGNFSHLRQQVGGYIEELLDISIDVSRYPYHRLKGINKRKEPEKLDPVTIQALIKMYDDIRDDKYWKEFKSAIEEQYKDLMPLFTPDLWRQIQFLDSEIVNYIHLETVKRRYPALSIHDSFLVPISRKEETIEIGMKAYKHTLKKYAKINIDPDHIPRLSE